VPWNLRPPFILTITGVSNMRFKTADMPFLKRWGCAIYRPSRFLLAPDFLPGDLSGQVL